MEKGYLLMLTHYDPYWFVNKPFEEPFSFDTGIEIIDAVARAGFNILFIGVSDAVIFKSHPELAKPYSRSIVDLKRLAAHARSLGLEIIPKLNFSKSEIHHHDHWSRAPYASWYADIDDFEGYLRKGFDCIDEIVEACEPKRYFHVGMDEDHSRSYTQYAETICALHAGLARRNLRTMVWNDSSIEYPNGQILVEKTISAYERIPKDIAHVLWSFRQRPVDHSMKLIRSSGFELWGHTGGRIGQLEEFSNSLVANGGKGMLLAPAPWCKCSEKNRDAMIEELHFLGKFNQGL